MTSFGVDYAFGSGVDVAQLHAAKVTFVCRYLSGTPGSGKDLAALEIKNYKSGGINLVCNWETGGQELSETQGASDAHAAQAELTSLANQSGIPALATAPVYFTADQPQQGTEADNLDYMRGVASVLGHDRTGLYAIPAVLEAYFAAGIGKYGWQDGGSEGQVPQANLQQYEYNQAIGPAEVDFDRAYTADYGQVAWAGAAPPPPPSTAPPNPKAQTYAGVTLTWGVGAGAPYAVQVWEGTGEEPGTLVYHTTTLTEAETAVQPLSAGVYSWHVGTNGGAWSATESFTISLSSRVLTETLPG